MKGGKNETIFGFYTQNMADVLSLNNRSLELQEKAMEIANDDALLSMLITTVSASELLGFSMLAACAHGVSKEDIAKYLHKHLEGMHQLAETIGYDKTLQEEMNRSLK